MLKNNQIILRAIEPNDIDFLFDLENDMKLWHITQTLVPFSRFDMEQYIISVQKQDPFAAGQVRFVITLVENDQPIGFVDLFNINPINQRAGIGIVIIEKFRGKNYGNYAIDLIEKYAFEILNLHQLYCNVEENNLSSLRLFEKHGFTVVGLKKDWNKNNSGWIGEYMLQKIRSN